MHVLHSGHRPHGVDLAEARIDSRQTFEQRLARLLEVAANPERQRRSWTLGIGWQEYTAYQGEEVGGERTVHIAHDADDYERTRLAPLSRGAFRRTREMVRPAIPTCEPGA